MKSHKSPFCSIYSKCCACIISFIAPILISHSPDTYDVPCIISVPVSMACISSRLLRYASLGYDPYLT